MGRDDGIGPGEVEFLDTGPGRGSGDGRGRRFALAGLIGLVAAGLVAAGLSGALTGGSSGAPTGSPTVTRAQVVPPTGDAVTGARSTSAAPPAAPSSPAGGAPISVTDLGHRLLGVHGDWELFARGSGVVVRIEFARGRITRTAVPPLQSGGPVYFVADAAGALVRPIDFVPSWFVPDGRKARRAPGLLGSGGLTFPGPDPRHVWVEQQRVVQVGLDGRPTGVRLTLPAGSSTYNAIPDGAGHLLATATGGVYDVRPGRTLRVTTGSVLAVGPTRFLVVECDEHARCHRVVVDRTTGGRRTLASRVSASAAQPAPEGSGVVSPDGTVAAIPVGSSTGRIALLDLATGATRTLNPSLELPTAGWQVLAFSPDSRYLFALAGGELYAVDIAGGQVRDLTTALGSRVLPRLEQLAIRE